MDDPSKIKLMPYLACTAAAIFSFFNLFQISVFNSISAGLMTDFHLSSLQMGWFSATYLIANTLWLVPGGLLIDRYSARHTALLFAFLDVMACFVISISHHLLVSIMMRFIQGMASAMSLLICARFANRWFANKASTAVGIMVAFALIGGVISNNYFPYLTENLGWRNALIGSGIMGIFFFLFMFIFLYDHQQQNSIAYATSKARLNHLINRKTIAYGIYIGLMNLPIFLLATLWGDYYLTQAYHVSLTTAGSICAQLYIGTILGAPCFGYLSDKLNDVKNLLAIAAAGALITLLILMSNTSLTITELKMVFFTLGFFSSSPIICYAALGQAVEKHAISATSSVAFLIANLIGALSQPLFGFLLGVSSSTTHSEINYTFALLILPLAFISCIIISWFFPQKNNIAIHYKE